MRMICENCDGRSEGATYSQRPDGMHKRYLCTQRDSDYWMQLVEPDSTCLDWEPAAGDMGDDDERNAETIPGVEVREEGS